MLTHVLYFLTHYLSIFHHCRIYLGFFLPKYSKIGIFTPGFGPKGVLISPEVPYTDIYPMLTDVSYLLTHYLSIFHHCRIYLGLFSPKIPKNSCFPPILVPRRVLLTTKVPYMDIYPMSTNVLYFLTHYLSIFYHCRIYLGFFSPKYSEIGVWSQGGY